MGMRHIAISPYRHIAISPPVGPHNIFTRYLINGTIKKVIENKPPKISASEIQCSLKMSIFFKITGTLTSDTHFGA
jgi:hypothetical protein